MWSYCRIASRRISSPGISLPDARVAIFELYRPLFRADARCFADEKAHMSGNYNYFLEGDEEVTAARRRKCTTACKCLLYRRCKRR